jgi:hypothetical protein
MKLDKDLRHDSARLARLEDLRVAEASYFAAIERADNNVEMSYTGAEHRRLLMECIKDYKDMLFDYEQLKKIAANFRRVILDAGVKGEDFS